MKPSEHDRTGRVCPQAGFCSVSVGGSLGVRRGRVLARLTGAIVTAGVVFSCFAASALAAEPPQIKPELYTEAVFATRAHIAAEVLTGSVQLEWKGEYATSEQALKEGKGIAAGGGETETEPTGNYNSEKELGLGTRDAEGGDETQAGETEWNILHHLIPNTTYYVRFIVKNHEGGKAERTFEFKTLPAGEPEIARIISKLWISIFRRSVYFPWCEFYPNIGRF